MIYKSLKIIFLNNEKAKLVLEHKYVGCFFTRCGCNSTLEASVNAWWQQHSGLINQQMLSISLMFCIIKGIHGRSEIRRNSYKWKELAKVTIDEGGSSDKNIEEFAAKLICEEYRRVQRFSRVKGSICMFSCCKICCRNQPNKLWIKIFCKFWFVFVMRRRSCTEV